MVGTPVLYTRISSHVGVVVVVSLGPMEVITTQELYMLASLYIHQPSSELIACCRTLPALQLFLQKADC